MTLVYSGDLQQVRAVSFLWALPLLPAAAAAVLGVAGRALERRFGRAGVAAVAIAAVGAAAVVALYALFGALLPLPAAERYLLDAPFSIFAIGALRADAALALDPLSATLVLLITLVATLVLVAASADRTGGRCSWSFFCHACLFLAAMLVLVLADNFFLMLVGWQGAGLGAALLIGLPGHDRERTDAAGKAFVANRVGDCGLLVGVALLFWGLGGGLAPGGTEPAAPRLVTADAPGGADIDLRTAGDRPPQASVRSVPVGPTLVLREISDQLALQDLYGRHPFAAALVERRVFGLPLVVLVCLALLLGAAGKSALVPLHGWLPEASAGPPPAAALIQATLVAAGVYLFARLGSLFALSPPALAVVAVAGALTAAAGAAGALEARDIRRLLAWSTVSQVGFMFLALAVDAPALALGHLVVHAFCKAGLILAVGAVIQRLAPAEPRDLRDLGGLAASMPRTRRAYQVAALVLAGFPLAVGFLARDAILPSGARLPAAPLLPGAVWAVGLVAAGLTAFYAARSYFLVFHARPPAAPLRGGGRESPRRITVAIAVLAAASLLAGPLLGWPASWRGRAPLADFLGPSPVGGGGALAVTGTATSQLLAWGLELGMVVVALLGWLAARACFRDVMLTGGLLNHLRAHFRRVRRRVTPRFGADAGRGLAALARVAAGADLPMFERGGAAPSEPAPEAGGLAVRLPGARIPDRVLGVGLSLLALAVLIWLLAV